MARVLCTGVDQRLIETRKLILEHAGHKVTTAMSEQAVREACQREQFDVAVIGQTIHPNEKRRILALLRQHCPPAKVLELYTVSSEKVLSEADDWLRVPATVPPELADRVSALAEKDGHKSATSESSQ